MAKQRRKRGTAGDKTICLPRLRALPMCWGIRRCTGIGSASRWVEPPSSAVRSKLKWDSPHLVADEKHCDWKGNRSYLALRLAPKGVPWEQVSVPVRARTS
jgi:hypothetical protein